MAENETLDTATSPRWRRVCVALRQGESETQLGQRIEKSFCDFVRRSINEVAATGVSLDLLLHAATSCPRDLPGLLGQCRGHPFAHVIAANAEEGSTRRELLVRVMNNLADIVFDQLGGQVVGRCPQWTNFDDFHTFLGGVREKAGGQLERIARKLADDPAWMPRYRKPSPAASAAPSLFDGQAIHPVAHPDPTPEATRSLLGMSLLDGRPE